MRGPLGRRTKGLAGMVIPASPVKGGGERWQALPLASGGGLVISGLESGERAGLVRAEGVE